MQPNRSASSLQEQTYRERRILPLRRALVRKITNAAPKNMIQLLTNLFVEDFCLYCHSSCPTRIFLFNIFGFHARTLWLRLFRKHPNRNYKLKYKPLTSAGTSPRARIRYGYNSAQRSVRGRTGQRGSAFRESGSRGDGDGEQSHGIRCQSPRQRLSRCGTLHYDPVGILQTFSSKAKFSSWNISCEIIGFIGRYI